MSWGAESSFIPIIDTHIHLFDPTRPQGVPWPEKDNENDKVLYRPARPDRFRSLTQDLGVVGAIEVECSPWLEDNQWVLDLAAKDTVIVGKVGDLEPGKPEFRRHLERFQRHSLFRGIRYGNLWGRSLAAEISRADFVADIKALADAGLGLDTANQDPTLIAALVRLTEKVPNLRAVVDHLAQMEPPVQPAARAQLRADLRELATRPQVFVKLSEVLRRVDGRVPADVDFYRPRMDEIWDIFGEDRIMYGSDWPNSDRWAPYPQVLNIVRQYVTAKGPAAAEKFFWKNSIRAYHWVKRAANQPEISHTTS